MVERNTTPRNNIKHNNTKRHNNKSNNTTTTKNGTLKRLPADLPDHIGQVAEGGVEADEDLVVDWMEVDHVSLLRQLQVPEQGRNTLIVLLS